MTIYKLSVCSWDSIKKVLKIDHWSVVQALNSRFPRCTTPSKPRRFFESRDQTRLDWVIYFWLILKISWMILNHHSLLVKIIQLFFVGMLADESLSLEKDEIWVEYIIFNITSKHFWKSLIVIALIVHLYYLWSEPIFTIFTLYDHRIRCVTWFVSSLHLLWGWACCR